MNNNLSFITVHFILAILVLAQPKVIYSAVFNNFDTLPVTEPNQIPGSGGNWLYTTAKANPNNQFPMTTYDIAGWRSNLSYQLHPNIYNFFRIYLNTYNSSHMGFETYGFFEIDDQNAARGNSLKYTITGGKNNATLPNANGLKITTKQHYLDYINDNQNPVDGGIKVGNPYIYFMNNSLNDNPVPFQEAQNCNRLSMYIHTPESMTNGLGGAEKPPKTTIDIGPYNDMGGHWYHRINTQGGGWAHIIIDGHPQHNNAYSNAASYPFPSWSVRDMGSDYFKSMYRWYITFKPYSGIAEPPYNIWFDEIQFYNDPEPQNNETINSPSVIYFPERKSFEIGFNDKYKNNAHSYSTYEIRYSFSQITNSNWGAATPAHILSDSRFDIKERADGKFEKWWPYYQSVWAPFKLSSAEDESKLKPGVIVYFAIRDISQVNGDGKSPISPGINRSVGGRDYQNHGSSFDYEGDKKALTLIKRINYYIGNSHENNSSQTPLAPPTGLKIVQ